MQKINILVKYKLILHNTPRHNIHGFIVDLPLKANALRLKITFSRLVRGHALSVLLLWTRLTAFAYVASIRIAIIALHQIACGANTQIDVDQHKLINHVVVGYMLYEHTYTHKQTTHTIRWFIIDYRSSMNLPQLVFVPSTFIDCVGALFVFYKFFIKSDTFIKQRPHFTRSQTALIISDNLIYYSFKYSLSLIYHPLSTHREQCDDDAYIRSDLGHS